MKKKKKLPPGITQLPSGNYRLKRMYKRKYYTITLDYLPDKVEAEKIFLRLIEEEESKKAKAPETFQEYARKYIDNRKNVLSPSTIANYESTLNVMDDDIKETPLDDFNQSLVTMYINRISTKLAASTVKKYHAFLSCVIREFRPEFALRTKLPQKAKKEPYIPTDDDVKRIFHALLESENHKRFYVPIVLASMGMRRAEICALTVDDLSSDNILKISKTKIIKHKGGAIIRNTTKTESSAREIKIPESLAEIIRKQGYVYNGEISYIGKILMKYEDLLGIPHFSLHKLRHYFASKSHALGMRDSVIMKLGGWKSDGVMKSIYRHAFEEDAKKEAEVFAEHVENLM